MSEEMLEIEKSGFGSWVIPLVGPGGYLSAINCGMTSWHWLPLHAADDHGSRDTANDRDRKTSVEDAALVHVKVFAFEWLWLYTQRRIRRPTSKSPFQGSKRSSVSLNPPRTHAFLPPPHHRRTPPPMSTQHRCMSNTNETDDMPDLESVSDSSGSYDDSLPRQSPRTREHIEHPRLSVAHGSDSIDGIPGTVNQPLALPGFVTDELRHSPS